MWETSSALPVLFCFSLAASAAGQEELVQPCDFGAFALPGTMVLRALCLWTASCLCPGVQIPARSAPALLDPVQPSLRAGFTAGDGSSAPE